MRTTRRRAGATNLTSVALAVTMLAIAADAARGQITDRQINAGLGLLPVEARAGAEVLVNSGAGFIVRRAGDNGWSCSIWTTDDKLLANCHQRVLTAKVELERKLSADGLSGAAIRDRFAELLATGQLSIPRGSVEISGAGAIVEGAEVPETLQGYYYVYFPFATPETLGLPGSDPGNGLPFLHHGGTADAHLMWPRTYATM
jgi:hypothetical protein